MKFGTRCVHSGTIRDEEQGGVNSPVYTSTSYAYLDRPDTVYPRYLNTPNEKAVAEKLASLEHTETALVLSSGMAAISTVLFAFLGQGDHVVFQKGLYGGTLHLVEREFPRLGIRYSIAEGTDAEDLEACIRKETKLLYIETPSNPLLGITDLEAVARLARRKKLISVIDNTFASPVNQQPAGAGIDIVLHSATKYIGGHSDLLAGAVCGSEAHVAQILETGMNLGGGMNGLTLYLLERSLKTIQVRVDRINDNAMELAHFLDSHPGIAHVNYPGLPGHPGHEIARRQMQGFGGMLSFEPSTGDSKSFQDNLQLIRPSMSLGGVESVCSTPALTSHRHLGKAGRSAAGISEELIRLSVGIEDVEDLRADLEQALDAPA